MGEKLLSCVSAVKMNVVLLSVLASFALAVQGETCDPYCNACKDVHDIATIICDATRGPCTIEDGEEDLNYLLGPEGEVITDITADECRKKCKEQAEHKDDIPPRTGNPCKFFHFEEGHKETQGKTRCSLQTECDGPSSYCDVRGCESGQLGCNKDCNPAHPCSLSEKTAWDHNKFHVICTDENQVGGDVDIYSQEIEGKDIAAGTICSTVRKCSEWVEQQNDKEAYYRRLAVYCDGSTDPATWKARPDAGSQTLSEAMIAEAGKIVEQGCEATCTGLTVKAYQGQWWADLVCDTSLEGDKLVEPNSCILLCDNHLKMTIDCEFDAEGVKDWRNAAGVALTDPEIIC